jgi:hypothetical protein
MTQVLIAATPESSDKGKPQVAGAPIERRRRRAEPIPMAANRHTKPARRLVIVEAGIVEAIESPDCSAPSLRCLRNILNKVIRFEYMQTRNRTIMLVQ